MMSRSERLEALKVMASACAEHDEALLLLADIPGETLSKKVSHMIGDWTGLMLELRALKSSTFAGTEKITLNTKILPGFDLGAGRVTVGDYCAWTAPDNHDVMVKVLDVLQDGDASIDAGPYYGCKLVKWRALRRLADQRAGS